MNKSDFIKADKQFQKTTLDIGLNVHAVPVAWKFTDNTVAGDVEKAIEWIPRPHDGFIDEESGEDLVSFMAVEEYFWPPLFPH